MKKIQKFKSFVNSAIVPTCREAYILYNGVNVKINSISKDDLEDMIETLSRIKMFDNERNGLELDFVLHDTEKMSITFITYEPVLNIKIPESIFNKISKYFETESDNEIIDRIINLLKEELTNIEKYVEFLNSEVV